jgi:hypothetical protein
VPVLACTATPNTLYEWKILSLVKNVSRVCHKYSFICNVYCVPFTVDKTVNKEDKCLCLFGVYVSGIVKRTESHLHLKLVLLFPSRRQPSTLHQQTWNQKFNPLLLCFISTSLYVWSLSYRLHSNGRKDSHCSKFHYITCL